MPRVGVLWHAASPEAEEEYLGALTKAFHELGYFEGKNIDLEHRFPAEHPLMNITHFHGIIPG